jgi:tetratricopeptide (TPR) repeat protein
MGKLRGEAGMGARQRLWHYSAYAAVLAALIVSSGFWYWQFEYLPNERLNKVTELRTLSDSHANSGAAQVDALNWFARNQRWLPPPAFDKITWGDVTLDRLILYAPSFVFGTFRKVTLTNAQLDGGNFIESKFAFDGIKENRNNFSNAVLKYAQFRDAKIAFTSFAGADLYRAIFDKADLCEVDFSNANLRQASFWGTKMDATTKGYLAANAWWQLVGLPWLEIKEFGDRAEKPADMQLLKASAGFKADFDPATKDFQRSSPDSLERGLALVSIAWARAVWGVDVVGEPEKISEDDKARGSCGADGIPVNAVQAADKAVCILSKLKEDTKVANLLGNARDTQAYVYMQNRDFVRALSTLRKIASEEKIVAQQSEFFKSGEPLFHYAIAQYAAGEKDAAIVKFKKAVEDYQPTHELHTLKQILFAEPFEPFLKTLNRKRWPGEPESPTCPAPQ